MIPKIEYEFTLMQVLALGFVKLSVLYFYRRIFPANVTSKSFNIATLFMIGIIVLWTLAFFFASLFDCGTHVSAQWTNLESQIKYCTSLDAEVAFAVSDMICDLLILVLPLPVVSP